MAQFIEIRDFKDPELDVYARLSENELVHRDRPMDGLFIAESPKVVERALNAGYEPVSMLLETKHIQGEASSILERVGDIPVYTAELSVLKDLTGFPLTRGVLCAMHRKELPAAEKILSGARQVAVLEEIVNPTNLGAIFRSAAAMNVDAVLLTHGCSDPLYRRAIRVSMGNVFLIPWTFLPEEDWPEKTIDRLKKDGFATAALALKEDSVKLDDPCLHHYEKMALVLGTEGEGLADATIEACDHTVMIPMSHGVDSLNVAAASAVAFWELCRRNKSE